MHRGVSIFANSSSHSILPTNYRGTSIAILQNEYLIKRRRNSTYP
uniref:Uncharacterized protein n=1 Tax=Arundo donax TaxID=35708 RepID=A0A0A9BC37_ARUDO